MVDYAPVRQSGGDCNHWVEILVVLPGDVGVVPGHSVLQVSRDEEIDLEELATLFKDNETVEMEKVNETEPGFEKAWSG
jgi:hypothetical protein